MQQLKLTLAGVTVGDEDRDDVIAEGTVAKVHLPPAGHSSRALGVTAAIISVHRVGITCRVQRISQAEGSETQRFI